LNHVNVEITFPLVAVAGLYVTVAVGVVLSIRLTVAVVAHVFPTASMNVYVKLPFHVNVCHDNHQLLVIVTHVLLNHVSVAITFPLVAVAGLYETVAVGVVLSIRDTVAVVAHVFPTASTNVYVNDQFPVNV
jgi:hypothetical protein